VDYFSRQILLPKGWFTNVRLDVSDIGEIRDIELDASSSDAQIIEGIVIPGMPNLHSHAFQRAMSGLSEFSVPGENDFWSWRETMYRLANIVSADQLQIIAAQLYMEMLKAGYTSVAEFHYLHHDVGGQPYAEKDELSNRVIAAATETGIGMTLLPVLYMASNFDGSCRGLTKSL
jgi:formimidoylglutamate deiminase